jgi:hypothetical protein
MGQLPGIFNGDRSDAERFITDLQMYVDFNRNCDNILDYRDKVRFALTLIQGVKVKGWKLGMADWVRRQHDDIITWNDFIATFNTRFLDSQREQTAKTKIENVNLRDNNMDQCISLFEELAADADYDLDTKPVWNLFQKGLPYKINNRIFSFYPPHNDWADDAPEPEACAYIINGPVGPTLERDHNLSLLKARAMDPTSAERSPTT